ncbi:MAG: tetratricopeptide repeat protein [Planctomycetota bacterium]
MSDWVDAEKFVEQAHDLFERGRFDAAESKLREALSLNPFEPEWHYNLGLTLEAAGRYREALSAIEDAVRLSPEDGVSYLLGGVAALRLDEFDRAVLWLERAAELDPGSIDAQLHLIDAFAQLGDRDRAETAFYLCQQIDDRDARPFSAMAEALLESGDAHRALVCLREAAERDADLPKLHSQLARAHAVTGRLERARQLFLIELRQDPGDTDTLMELADVLVRMKRLTEASEKLRRVLETEPDHSEAHLALGRIERDLGRPESGLSYLELALRLDSDQPGVRRALSEALMDRGSPGDLARTRRMLEADAESLLQDGAVVGADEFVELGDLLLRAGTPERAYWAFRSAQERPSDESIADHELLQRLSVAAFQKGDVAQGNEWAAAVLKRDPRFVPAMHNLAVAAFREHRNRRCRYWIERAIGLDPDDRAMKRLRLHLGMRSFLGFFESIALSFRERRLG